MTSSSCALRMTARIVGMTREGQAGIAQGVTLRPHGRLPCPADTLGAFAISIGVGLGASSKDGKLIPPLGCEEEEFWWKQAPPAEWHFPPMLMHQLVLQLQGSATLIQEQDSRHHEGRWYKGDALLMRAEQPSRWWTEGSKNLPIALSPPLGAACRAESL
jgi:hypothetical protein